MTQRSRVPRPDADEMTVLRFYARRDTPVVVGPCAQYDDDDGRCTGTLSVEEETLVGAGGMIQLECDECDVLSFRTNDWFLTRARSELREHHYETQLGGDR